MRISDPAHDERVLRFKDVDRGHPTEAVARLEPTLIHDADTGEAARAEEVAKRLLQATGPVFD